MDGTPISSLQPGVIRTALEGLMSQNVPVIDRITSAQRFVVGDQSGTVGIMPSKAMLSPAPATTVIGVAEGADANVNSWAPDKHSFNTIRLAEAGTITEGAKRAALANNINGFAQCMELPVKKVCADMNQMLRVAVTDTSLNLTQAAGTAWTSSSATPLKNITAAIKKIGGRNAEIMAMFGYDEIDNLRFHPDFTNGFQNLTSAGVPNDRIAQIISLVCGINNVVIGDNIYNAANPGQAVSIGFQFNGVAWIGYAKDFVVVEQGAFLAETGRDILKASDICTYERRPYIGRGHQEMGCVITGVAS